jgi:hypothetical protein
MSVNADFEAVQEMLDKRGDGKKVEDLVEQMLKERKCRTKAGALGLIRADLELEKTVVPELEGTVLAVGTVKGRGGVETRQAYVYVGERGTLRVNDPPPTLRQFGRLKLTNFVDNHNLASGYRYLAAAEDSKLVPDGITTMEQIEPMTMPYEALGGGGRPAIIHGFVKFVDAPVVPYEAPKPGPDGKIPPKTKERPKNLPVYNPQTKVFGLQLILADGAKDQKIKVEDIRHLRGLFADADFGAGGWSDFYQWFLSEKTPDSQRFSELENALRGKELFACGTAGDTISRQGQAATKLEKPYFSLSEPGWILRREVIEARLNGGATAPAPSSEAPTAPVSAPTAAGGDAEQLILTNLEMAAPTGMTGAEIAKLGDKAALGPALVSLQKQNRIVKDGSVYKLVES